MIGYTENNIVVSEYQIEYIVMNETCSIILFQLPLLGLDKIRYLLKVC